jgi:murein DD-endopeptidase MepM/ murein hydrolase activator NlpD
MEGLSSAQTASTLYRALSGPAADLQKRLAAFEHKPDGRSQELRQQLTEFSSLLIFQMLQAMRRTVPKSQLVDTGFAHDLYMSLFDQEVARHIADRRALGLTALLQSQFEAHQGSSPPPKGAYHALEAYRQQLRQNHAAFTRPVDGPLSSPFGWRQDPFEPEKRWHDGVDIAAPAESLVQAAAPGRVIFSGTQHGYGNLLIIDHQDGYQTYYAHNAENLVPVGTQVQRAQPIARVGLSGRATGPHVHFEVHKHGHAVDPAPLLNP